jgi:hypothetical protein
MVLLDQRISDPLFESIRWLNKIFVKWEMEKINPLIE